MLSPRRIIINTNNKYMTEEIEKNNDKVPFQKKCD